MRKKNLEVPSWLPLFKDIATVQYCMYSMYRRVTGSCQQFHILFNKDAISLHGRKYFTWFTLWTFCIWNLFERYNNTRIILVKSSTRKTAIKIPVAFILAGSKHKLVRHTSTNYVNNVQWYWAPEKWQQGGCWHNNSLHSIQ